MFSINLVNKDKSEHVVGGLWDFLGKLEMFGDLGILLRQWGWIVRGGLDQGPRDPNYHLKYHLQLKTEECWGWGVGCQLSEVTRKE